MRPIDDWRRFELENKLEYATKNPNRVAAGKQVAAKTGHEELSARARQAAETRALRASGSHSGSRPAYSKATVQKQQQRRKKRGQGEDDREDEEKDSEESKSKRAERQVH